MLIFAALILLLVLVYLFLIRCRSGHPGLPELRKWAYAHRGLHGNGVPENSLEAFRLAKEAGYGIELDVHLLADGNLAVIHDASLKRTAGVDVYIEDLTIDQLQNYTLEGTQERIPSFEQVLELYRDSAPLIIELKTERGNAAALCGAVCKALDAASCTYCIESFDPRCIFWLKKNRPEIVRGQLARNFFAYTNSGIPWYLKLILSFHMVNFLIAPDFIAYRFKDRNIFGTILCRKIWGAQGVAWTIKTQQEHEQALKDGWISIFEGFRP